ncbi:hypothetical protein LJC33_04070 [Eubacteriales bacterium OttesenSCG-928-N13]|nr:hypothetical protein [Eubacteriales bacterium OttesenSCG-928-N13]
MSTSNFAVFVDLENAGAKESMMNNIIEKVKIRGDILLGKVYGYEERFSELKECLLSNTFNVVPSLRYGKLKSMGKHVLGISRSEVASGIFIKACSEFIFLESVAPKKAVSKPNGKEKEIASSDIGALVSQVETILQDQDEDMMYASELKDTLTRLRPDFNERSYGCATFGKLIAQLSTKSQRIKVWTEDSSMKIGLISTDFPAQQLNKLNWLPAFKDALKHFKADGFERINPSILKGAIQADYPDFEEKQIGFKRFSDIMKELEKEKLLVVEMDEAKTMLLKIC